MKACIFVLTQRSLLRLGWSSDDGQARPRFARSPKARGRSLDLRHNTRVVIVHTRRRRLVQRVAALVRQMALEEKTTHFIHNLYQFYMIL